MRADCLEFHNISRENLGYEKRTLKRFTNGGCIHPILCGLVFFGSTFSYKKKKKKIENNL